MYFAILKIRGMLSFIVDSFMLAFSRFNMGISHGDTQKWRNEQWSLANE